MRLLLATRNMGKLGELRRLLADLPLQLVSLDELGITADIPETASTYEENAALKARGYAQLSGLTALADDSGLEVEALGGAPGVQSALWAGPNASDRDRIELLLEQLRDVPPERRRACFRSVVAIAAPDRPLRTAEGTVCGWVMDRPRGSHGFGYDPVFLLPGLGQTMAELDTDTKNQFSHRARAIVAARPILQEMLAGEMNDERFD